MLVLVHEFGHFFSAKRFGIRVDEFGFGFPPKLFGIKKGETEYTINALPFGGFVKIFGEDPRDVEPKKNNFEEADMLNVEFFENKEIPKVDDFSRSLIAKPRWQQAIVMFAGILANFILAWFLFSIGFMSGLPTSVGASPKGSILENIHLTVVSTLPGSPAEISGLKSGDKIIEVKSADDFISEINPETFKSFIVSHPDKEIEIGYTRGQDKNVYVAKVIPKTKEENGQPMIGISMDQIGVAKLPFFKAFWEGLKLDVYVTKATTIGLYNLVVDAVRGQASMAQVTGPVGMVGIVGDAYKFGFSYLLSFAALISINLAIINLIPFPALDGGRLLFLLIEKIKGSRINPKFAGIANTVGFFILIALMLLVTYHDIVKLF